MLVTISFVSEEEKVALIEKYSSEYELIETRYLFSGNELKFKKKVSGLTVDERLSQQESKILEQEQAIMELTALLSGGGVNV